MERSTIFYRDILGLELVGENVVEEEKLASVYQLPQAPKLKLRWFQTRGEGTKTTIEAIQFLSPENPVLPEGILHHSYANNYLGACHICFTVKNIEDTYNDLVKRGVEFNSPPITFEVEGLGTVKMTFFKDPDNTLLELLEITPK